MNLAAGRHAGDDGAGGGRAPRVLCLELSEHRSDDSRCLSVIGAVVIAQQYSGSAQ
jgi:hypothetical protein